MDYYTLLYVFFGILPSLTWLFYYLSKDMHPEPKKMIVKIFFWGVLATLPVFFIQVGLSSLLDEFNISKLARDLIYWFVIISFIEEYFKYLVIRFKVLNSQHLDEPVDLMIYMVISALGFAALENILYLLAPTGDMSFEQVMGRTLVIYFFRFVGATFLHTLCSAVVGYFLAIAICETKFKNIALLAGMTLATLLHGLYDFSIMTLGGNLKLYMPIIVIATLAFIVFTGFDKLKNLKGICKIK